jgi:hypothetical protein
MTQYHVSPLEYYKYNEFQDSENLTVKVGGYPIQNLIHSNSFLGGSNQGSELYESLKHLSVPLGLIMNEKLGEANLHDKYTSQDAIISDEFFQKLVGGVESRNKRTFTKTKSIKPNKIVLNKTKKI